MSFFTKNTETKNKGVQEINFVLLKILKKQTLVVILLAYQVV